MESTTGYPEKGNLAIAPGLLHRRGFWASILKPFRTVTGKADNEISGTPAVASQAPMAIESSVVPKAQEDTDNPNNGGYTKAENDAACSNLLKVYVGEAERYDKALVESWKNDMTGLLIFSGLFSASLTAFIVESYKTLQPDPADTAIDLLRQMISLQLASTAPVYEVIPPPFRVTTASLACNILWFIGLTLSLACSLLATLVDQWAREFLHKTEIRPAPVNRARAFSFLYRGLQDFNMHAVVDAIPFLLHFSLFLFFGGLVPFLLPINVIVAVIVAVILVIFLALYMILTVLPVVWRACPYRTPLSSIAWRLARYIGGRIYLFGQFFIRVRSHSRTHDSNERPRKVESDAVLQSMTDAVLEESSKDSQDRDIHAMQWTLKSLTDDNELLPFLEAIPELVCGHKEFRRDNDHLLLPLLNTSDPQLSISNRVVDLLRRSDNYPQEAISGALTRQKIEMVCLKAIWAMGMTFSPKAYEQPHLVWFDGSVVAPLKLKGTLDPHYAVAARAAVLYSWSNVLLACSEEMRRVQNRPDAALLGYQMDAETLQTIRNIVASVRTIIGMVDRLEPVDSSLWLSISERFRFVRGMAAECLPTLDVSIGSAQPYACAARDSTVQETLADTKQCIDDYRTCLLGFILDELLEASMKLQASLFKFSITFLKLLSDLPAHPVAIEHEQWNFIHYVPDPSSIVSMTSEIHDIDDIMMAMLQLVPRLTENRHTPSEISRYLVKRNSDKAFLHILSKCELFHLKLSFLGGLRLKHATGLHIGVKIKATWMICRYTGKYKSPIDSEGFEFYWVDKLYSDSLLSKDRSRFPSTMAIVSAQLLEGLNHKLSKTVASNKLLHPPMSTEAGWHAAWNEIHDHALLAHHLPNRTELYSALDDTRKILETQLNQTRISILAQLLSAYSTESTPYRGCDTLRFLRETNGQTFRGFSGPATPEIQFKFASGVQNLQQCLAAKPNDVELVKTIEEVWRAFTHWIWLDDVTAASILAEVTEYYLHMTLLETEEKYVGIGSAQSLHEHCSRVIKAAQATEESVPTYLHPSLRLNFIRPAFP